MGHAELFPRMSTSCQRRRKLREEHSFSFQGISSTGRFGETLFLKTMRVNFTGIVEYLLCSGSVPSVYND